MSAVPPPGSRDAVLVSAVRTPTAKGRPARRDKPGGALHGWHPVDLAAEALRAALARAGYAPDGRDAALDDVLVGCVGQAGEQSFNLARNAALAAGLPEAVPAATLDRQCGSSQQALAFAAQAIRAGDQDAVLVGGVESMSRVPMGSAAAGADPYGPRIAERYPGGLVPQGVSAELIAARWDLGRAELDAWAAGSHRRAAAAAASGAVEAELLPLAVDRGDGPTGDMLRGDEGVRPETTPEALASLEPAFREAHWERRFPEAQWRVHAGNASQLADGAAALLVMSRERAQAEGRTPLARVRASVAVGSDPILNLTGVIPATRRVLARAGLDVHDVDLFEVNEAFAPVVLAWLAETGADPARVNVRGGAIANGHPLGASGAKLSTTLLHALSDRGGALGVQVMCEGGGMANATVFERS
ncbi:MAG: thiolase family protein [Trueperaceae bacterium]|nr:thiolase family protein [Trueperaceae bacterium]